MGRMIEVPAEEYIGIQELEKAGVPFSDRVMCEAWLFRHGYQKTLEWIRVNREDFIRGELSGFTRREHDPSTVR